MTAWRDVLGVTDIRRIELAWALSQIGGSASTVAVLVYAYGHGGATTVAVYGIARTLPGAVVTPVLTSVVDRVGCEWMLRTTTGARAILVGGSAIAVASGASPAVAIILAAISASVSAVFRPVHAAVVPWLVRTPAELTSTYVLATFAESSAAIIGPLLAGLCLASAGPAEALGVAATALGLATLAAARLRVPGMMRSGGADVTGTLGRAVDGVVALTRVAAPAGLIVLAFAQTYVRGALVVLLVLVSVDLLGLGAGGVGWLNAAIGVGGLAGAAVAAAVVRVTRLGRCVLVGVALWGLPLIAISAYPTVALSYLALVVAGMGNALEDSAAFTLVPRLLEPGVAGRALGGIELVVLLGTGAGSLSAPALVAAVGLRGSLAVLGCLLVALAALHTRRFTRIDRSTSVPAEELGLLRSLPMFAPLPVAKIQCLASGLTRHRYADGAVVMSEGEIGETFHLVASGDAAVTVRGEQMPGLTHGDGFGEIALLHGIPRTATVIARGELETVSLSRQEFLDALAMSPIGIAAASDLAEHRQLRTKPVG